jgi:hypothetical protein
MMRPEPEQFRSNGLIALYGCVAPVKVKVRGVAEPREYAMGSIVDIELLPAAALAPINQEAVYWKTCAIVQAVRDHGWLPDASVVACSLGAPLLSQVDASEFVKAWLRDPQPVTDN